MKKRILVGLLTTMLAVSNFTTSFAIEEFDVNDEEIKNNIAIEDMVDDIKVFEDNDGSIQESVVESEIEHADNENVQMKKLPILRYTDKGIDEQSISLMSETNNPVVRNVRSDDFYAETSDFNIKIGIKNMLDTRSKLKIAVVDEDDVVLAQQKGVYYQQNELVYQMKIEKEVDVNKNYFVQFSYTGKYELEYDIYDATITPITKIVIKDAEVIDRKTNTFKLNLINATAGNGYTLIYKRSYNDDESPVIKDVTVADDKSIFVEFGDNIPFSASNYIYIYPLGETGLYYNYIDYTYVGAFYDGEKTVSNDGVSCDKYISSSATDIWFNLYQKGYGGSYNESDVKNINVYMMDVTNGEMFGTMEDVEFRNGNVFGTLSFDKKLDKTHKYMMVFKDGYSIRVDDELEIISEAKIDGMWCHVSEDGQGSVNVLPSNINKFWVYISAYNIIDGNNINVELISDAGKIVAVSTYDDGRYLMTATEKLTDGKYVLKATYNNVVYSRTINVRGDNEVCFQLGRDVTVYNGKTYIGVTLETENLDPAKLSYKLVLSSGEEITPMYYRSLFEEDRSMYGEDSYKNFVLIIDKELTGVDHQHRATLKIYDGSNYIAPDYDNNMSIYSIDRATQPFLYDKVRQADTEMEFFIEGLSKPGSFNLCAYDELTNTGIEISSVNSSQTSAVFSKEDFKKINQKRSFYDDLYFYTSTMLCIECDGEYVNFCWSSSDMMNYIFEDMFGFQKRYTNRMYEVLNLPYKSYDYYKLAASESELSAKSYQKIDEGLIYKLDNKQAEQTVYAQFKTSDGVESKVREASIVLDTEAPVWDIISDIPTVFVIDENERLIVSIDVDSNEDGQICFNFYDADNNKIGYERTVSNSSGISDTSITFWANEYNYENATRLGIYMVDKAGNKSEEFSYDVSVRRKYTNYTSGETYLKINNETGAIVEAKSTGTNIYIPTEINGVTVTAIEKYAFVDNGEALRISIPESITSISEFAFDDIDEFTLLVKENSTAHHFAMENDISFEIVRYKKGDILADGVINSKDAVRLAQYLAKWDIKLTDDEKQAADVVADGTINAKDAVKLAQYLAKWDITLD